MSSTHLHFVALEPDVRHPIEKGRRGKRSVNSASELPPSTERTGTARSLHRACSAIHIPSSLGRSLPLFEPRHRLIREHGISDGSKIAARPYNRPPLCGTEATLASRIKRGLCNPALVALNAGGLPKI